MPAWADPGDPVLASITGLAGDLADPVRLSVLQLLTAEGPHTPAQLADAIGVSMSRLGNHLARLRASGLVTAEHTGRHAVYRTAAPGLGALLEALSRYAHADPARWRDRPPAPADIAHTCYDHAAGRLGVAIFDMLLGRAALLAPDAAGAVRLGPGQDAFADLGVDLGAVRPGRRKLATACLDRTLRRPHLGGALGGAVLDALLAGELVRPGDEERELRVTPRGEATLGALLPGFEPG
ncbi:ArsR/SmtB family transcription factor [Actinomadura roseirufa]|uniref:ArsR/SmtB family transcription factor n=1 Tax=Actinomadura roseirufa TaxID=2094049 RepID=UPI0010413B6B|nr:winged helix-turn-helix domain-containing protein [Actinomadura roseirufa]